MSLFESGGLNAEVSLAAVLGGESPSARVPKLAIPDLLEVIARGGWPSQVNRGLDQTLQANRDYLEQIRQVDVSRVAGSRRDPVKLRSLMQSLARNVSTDVSIKTLMADTRHDDGELSRATVDGYLDTLERLRIIEDQPAWSTHLRSAATLRLAPKRHYIDQSLAVAALRATPTTLLADLNYAGFLFESMVIRDLRILSQPKDGTVFHYRDSNGLEVDAIVELPDGRWGAFEVKLGTNLAEEGAANLLRFHRTVDTTKRGTPGVLAVITGDGEYAVTRPDGVSLIPISALRP
jgi:predicted AAA+ superfamily ATPase